MFKQRLNAPVGDRLSFVVLPSRSILNEDCHAGFGFCLPHERPLGTKEQVFTRFDYSSYVSCGSLIVSHLRC